MNRTASVRPSSKAWLQRLGVAGFFFFLLKGLLWLVLPASIAYFGGAL